MSDVIEQATRTQDAKPLKDWRKIVASSSLPDDVKRLIETVVRKTRLWKRERASVARELIAHFHDASEAGVASEEAIKRFGDAKQAAKLIRRAKIRNRSYLWHARRFVQRVLLVLILCYIGVGVYYFSGKPSPSVDYIAKLNAPILATPESDWAWPIYREAAIALKADPLPEAVRPSEAGWDQTVAWLDRHQPQLALIRGAAGRSAFGHPLGQSIADADRELVGDVATAARSEWAAGSVVSVLLPYLQHMRSLALVLAADAALAMEREDVDRALADINALYAMSDQLRKRDLLVTDLVSISIRSLAQSAFSEALENHARGMSDESLRRFAHSQTHLQTAADLVTFTGERYMFHDLVQRIYTDDGEGDGRITPVAWDVFSGVSGVAPGGSAVGVDGWHDRPLRVALSPAVLLLSASRKELTEMYDRLMDVTEARLSRSLRDLPSDTNDARIVAIRNSPIDNVRYAMLTILMPSLNRVQVTAERALGQQEGLQVAIGLELYRRKHGAYPPSLEALVPQYLPQVPADRITGEPLCYRLRDGKPVVYSRGMDRDDDGGVTPIKNGEPAPRTVAIGGEPVDGDWVLFPIP